MSPWSNRSGSGSWLGREELAIYLLVIVNVAVFAWCTARTAPGALTASVLIQAGALVPWALSGGERWRLLAHGFLHLNLLHLATNMFCLVVFGGPLIRRVKALYFLLVYLAAIVAGGIASVYAHAGPFVSVGASGGVSGLLGALVGLSLLGKPAVPPGFLVANIGLNVLLSASVANIDAASHLGGFTGGLIACAVLDLAERLGSRLLQCKFPEFLKVNGAVLLAAPAVAVLGLGGGLPGSPATGDAWALGLGYAAACLGAVKLADLVLPLRKGLAATIVALAVGNAALIWALGTAYAPTLARTCWQKTFPPWLPQGTHRPLSLAVDLMCAHLGRTTLGLTVLGFLLTLLLYAWDLRRGINDVGFVGATLRANRNRSGGL